MARVSGRNCLAAILAAIYVDGILYAFKEQSLLLSQCLLTAVPAH
jgi:hypothetical protein